MSAYIPPTKRAFQASSFIQRTAAAAAAAAAAEVQSSSDGTVGPVSVDGSSSSVSGGSQRPTQRAAAAAAAATERLRRMESVVNDVLVKHGLYDHGFDELRDLWPPRRQRDWTAARDDLKSIEAILHRKRGQQSDAKALREAIEAYEEHYVLRCPACEAACGVGRGGLGGYQLFQKREHLEQHCRSKHRASLEQLWEEEERGVLGEADGGERQRARAEEEEEAAAKAAAVVQVDECASCLRSVASPLAAVARCDRGHRFHPACFERMVVEQAGGGGGGGGGGGRIACDACKVAGGCDFYMTHATVQRHLTASARSMLAAKAEQAAAAPAGGPHDEASKRAADRRPLEDFRSASVTPTLEDLVCDLPQELVTQLRFNAVPGVDNADLHLERHFRLLRHDAVCAIGAAFNEACAYNNAAQERCRNLERAVPYTLTEATVSAEGSVRGRTCLELTGTVQLPDTHPLWYCTDDRSKKEWLAAAKTFFQSSCVVFIMAKDMRRNPTVVAQVARFEYQRVPFVEGKCVQLMLKVLTETPLQKELPYKVLATRHLWSGVSDVLRQLQRTESPFPFGPQLLGLEQPKSIAPPARYHKVMSDTLEPGQRDGVVAALTTNVSLIQGPPGTGKTHTATEIAKCLLKGGEGEYLVIMTSTYHSLDQLMQRVQEKVGAACTFARLGNAAKRLDFNRVPRHLLFPAQQRINLLERKIDRCGPRPGGYYWDNGVAGKYGLDCLDLTESEEDWLAKTRALPPSEVFWHLIGEWANNKQAKSRTKLPGLFGSERSATKARMDAFSRSELDRRRILAEMRDECNAQRSRAQDELCTIYQDIEDLKHSHAAEVVTERVVGCTTSYAARHPALLRALAARGTTTLMVEDAAEVLEANVLVCLSDSLDRLILIGDHKQLRPKVEEYKLSVAGSDAAPGDTEVDYRGTDLNRSLFERLVIGGLPYVSLNVQHRMFPRLAGVVQRLAYPELTSAPEAPKDGVHIPGVEGQLLFVDHGFAEGKDSTSITNKREAEYAVEIAWYMIQRGVKPQDITILSPYLGQVNAISTLLKQRNLGAKHAERDQADLNALVGVADDAEAKQHVKMIRVASVDNFQGEESRYILLSLVRSNDDGQVGWVKETERVLVMLSRAQEGMIVLGNTHTLLKKARADSAWSKVLRDLGQDGLVVQGLPLVCKNHPSFRRSVASAEELRQAAPSGGCTEECGRQMPCGHVCPDRCHFDDPGHAAKRRRCPAPVERVCDEDKQHVYSVQCGRAAGAACPLCEDEKKQAELRRQRELRKREVRMEEARRRLAAVGLSVPLVGTSCVLLRSAAAPVHTAAFAPDHLTPASSAKERDAIVRASASVDLLLPGILPYADSGFASFRAAARPRGVRTLAEAVRARCAAHHSSFAFPGVLLLRWGAQVAAAAWAVEEHSSAASEQGWVAVHPESVFVEGLGCDSDALLALQGSPHDGRATHAVGYPERPGSNACSGGTTRGGRYAAAAAAVPFHTGLLLVDAALLMQPSQRVEEFVGEWGAAGDGGDGAFRRLEDELRDRAAVGDVWLKAVFKLLREDVSLWDAAVVLRRAHDELAKTEDWF